MGAMVGAIGVPSTFRALEARRAQEGQTRYLPQMAKAPDFVREHADTIAGIQKSTEESLGPHQRSIESLSNFLGRPRTLYFAVAFLICWLLGNRLSPKPWDPPPYPLLQFLVSSCAFFLTIVVLTAQNRQLQTNQKHAQLQLHYNMLEDQKISKIIELAEELRRDLPSVRNRHDPEAKAMQEPADANQVLTALEESLEE